MTNVHNKYKTINIFKTKVACFTMFSRKPFTGSYVLKQGYICYIHLPFNS